MSTKAERRELRQPDEFQLQAGRAMEWILERKNALVGLGVAAVVVVGGIAAINAMRASKEEKAGAALSAALELAQRPVMGEPAAAQPGVETFASQDAKAKGVTEALEKVRSENAGSNAARTAGAQLGFWKLDHGDSAGAATLLQEYLNSAGSDDPLRVQAQSGYAAALENQGKLDDAAQAWSKLAEAGAPEQAAFQTARLAFVQKKPDAKAQLEKVTVDYAKDPVAAEARKVLELADLPPPPPPGSAAPAAVEPAPAKAAPGKGAPAKKPAPAPKKK